MIKATPSVLLLGLILFSTLPSSVLSQQLGVGVGVDPILCADDDFYTFGHYFFRGQKVERTCAWITAEEDDSPAVTERRRNRWCNHQQFQNVVRDKCPQACLKVECLNEPINCDDLLPIDQDPTFPRFWHDATGEDYDCDYYAKSRNCFIFGGGYENFGWTAKQACCACGGGLSGGSRTLRRKLEAPGVESTKKLRGSNDETN